MIVNKYGVTERDRRTRVIILPFGGGLWRNIVKGWDNFCENTSFKVRNGRTVKFGGQDFER